MERIPSPKDLRGAAAVAQSLAYVVGLAGVLAGGVAFSDGDTAGAVLAWVVTFAAGALLMIVAMAIRGLSAILGRIARIESDVALLVADAGRGHEDERDPWARHNPPY